MKQSPWAKLSVKFMAVDGFKVCASCEQKKPVEQFLARKLNCDGLDTSCRICLNEKRKKEADPKLVALYSKHWRERNPDTAREGTRAYRATRNGRANVLLSSARNKAKERSQEYSLDESDIRARVIAGVCEVTGLQLQFDGIRNPFGPSLDRIDSKIGYTKQNTRVVVWMFNAARNVWGDEAVYVMADALSSRSRKAGLA